MILKINQLTQFLLIRYLFRWWDFVFFKDIWICLIDAHLLFFESCILIIIWIVDQNLSQTCKHTDLVLKDNWKIVLTCRCNLLNEIWIKSWINLWEFWDHKRQLLIFLFLMFSYLCLCSFSVVCVLLWSILCHVFNQICSKFNCIKALSWKNFYLITQLHLTAFSIQCL